MDKAKELSFIINKDCYSIVVSSKTKYIGEIYKGSVFIQTVEGDSLGEVANSFDKYTQEIVQNVDANSKPKTMRTDIKYTSSIPGTAKLVRAQGRIFIAKRKGKTTFNQTTYDSVCISDDAKVSFFNLCKKYHGANIFSFDQSTEPFKAWDNYMRKIYAEGLSTE